MSMVLEGKWVRSRWTDLFSGELHVGNEETSFYNLSSGQRREKAVWST